MMANDITPRQAWLGLAAYFVFTAISAVLMPIAIAADAGDGSHNLLALLVFHLVIFAMIGMAIAVGNSIVGVVASIVGWVAIIYALSFIMPALGY